MGKKAVKGRRLEPGATVHIEGKRGVWTVERLIAFEGRTMVSCVRTEPGAYLSIDRSKVRLV